MVIFCKRRRNNRRNLTNKRKKVFVNLIPKTRVFPRIGKDYFYAAHIYEYQPLFPIIFKEIVVFGLCDLNEVVSELNLIQIRDKYFVVTINKLQK